MMACAAYGTWSSLGLEILRCYSYKFYTNTPSSQIKSKKKKKPSGSQWLLSIKKM